MSLQGTGRVIILGPPGRPTKCYIYVPLEVVRDSQFPEEFKRNRPVDVEIKGREMIVSLPKEDG